MHKRGKGTTMEENNYKTTRKENLSKRILKYMEDHSLTEKEAAALSGINYTTFNSYVLRVSYPEYENEVKMAAFLGVRTETLGRDPDVREGRETVYRNPSEDHIMKVYEDDQEYRRYADTGISLMKKGALSEATAIVTHLLDELS